MTTFRSVATKWREDVTKSRRVVTSPFFSVDVAVREDGVLRVVEIGTASDLVGWEADRFAALWPAA
jgi:hypothetical protein